ncbi:MAG: hypothetical protein MK102_04855 [Fuerstiella sp.]|nr:hypothetical protein [Fuerstiella sp.]
MKRLIGTICLIAATTMAVGGDESQAHNRGRRVKSTGIRRGSVNRGSEARRGRASRFTRTVSSLISGPGLGADVVVLNLEPHATILLSRRSPWPPDD